MRELFDTTLNETDTPFSKKQLIEAVQNAEVLVPTVTDKIDEEVINNSLIRVSTCLLYTSPSPRDKRQSRMPSSA